MNKLIPLMLIPLMGCSTADGSIPRTAVVVRIEHAPDGRSCGLNLPAGISKKLNAATAARCCTDIGGKHVGWQWGTLKTKTGVLCRFD